MLIRFKCDREMGLYFFVLKVRIEEVEVLHCECLSRSTVDPLVDLSRTTASLIIIGIADVPKIGFEIDSMFKKSK